MNDLESTSVLIAHKGAHAIDREGLALLPTPPPQGPKHVPVPHIELVDLITAEAQRLGLRIGKERFAVGRSKDEGRYPGTALFGVMDFRAPEGASRSRSIAFRASNWRELGIRLVAGQRVFCCDNMALSGDEVVLSRRHTSGLDLERELREGFERFLEQGDTLERRIRRFQETTVGPEEATRLFLDSPIPERLKLRSLETFFNREEWGADLYLPGCPRNLDQVENAFTRVARDLPLHTAMGHTQAFASFLDKAVVLN